MQLAGFTLDAVIHAVGDTVVAAARDAAGRPVVLKLLDTDTPAPEQLARWRHEYALLRSLDAPQVIKAESLQSAGRSLVLVLEDFGRCNLAQAIERHRFTLAERLQLALQLAEALSSVHAAGLVHGDLAPKNVLVDLSTLRLKLCDFGLASRLNPEARRSPDGFPHGTLAYVAPEQTGRTNLAVDQRSDFYSLGATLYELFAGRPPFTMDDPVALLHAQLALVPAPINELDPGLPPVLAGLVAKLLAKDPDARYQSSHGVRHDLQQMLAQLEAGRRIVDFPLASQDVPERFRVVQRLIGRDAQSALLQSAFERASGGASELLLVSGYSGIGKTALVAALHGPVVARRGYYLRGKCDQYRRHRPYAALADAFRSLAQQLAVEGRPAYWQQQLGGALGDHAGAVVELVPELTLLIGTPPPLPQLPASDTETRLHLAFGRFVQALATRSHPVLLFVDDLQWADAATLRLLEQLLAEPIEQALLVVGAFRENEVSDDHPLRALQAALLPTGRVDELFLGPLPPAAVAELVAETLRAPLAEVSELATLCHDKTGGNPFFLVQFLRQLHEQGDLHYARAEGRWRWRLEAIRARGMTDNVIELMLDQLHRLPKATEQLVAQAAGLGEVFSLSELMALCGLSAADTAMRLWPALQAGLLQPLSEDYRFSDSPELLAQARYRFLHDRVQQAAHELTPPAQRAALLLQTGRRLRDASSPAELEQRLFTVLECLNGGAVQLQDGAERAQLLALNLRGADKARSNAAHPLAVQLLRQALQLSQSAPMSADQALQLYLGLCESTYLAGDFAAAEALYAEARAACPAPLAQAQLLAVQADQYHIQGRFDDAHAVLLQALALLGQPFPADEATAMAAFPAEMGAALQLLAQHPAEALMQAPELRDPEQLLLMRLLYTLTFSTYQTGRFAAFVVDACRLLRITLQHGQCDLSAIACIAFMTALSAAKQPYSSCHAIGATALRLAEQRGNRYIRSTVYQYYNAFYQHWGESLFESLAPMDRGLELGLAGVNPLSSGYCALLRCVNRFIVGTPLPELQQEAERSLKYLQASHQEATLAMLRHGVLQPLAALRGQSVGALKFDTEAFSGSDTLLAQDGPPSIPWAMASTAMLRHAVLMDDEAAWRRCAGRLEAIGQVLPDSPSWVEARFYLLLGLLRWDADLEAAQPHLQLFEQWAQTSPSNYETHRLIGAAEWARLCKDERGAMDLYARAIDSAAEQGWVVLEALANELYARFWTELQQRQLAKQFIREAYYQYRRWGATLKCRQLEARWPQQAFRVALQRAQGGSMGSQGSFASFGSKSLNAASTHGTAGPSGGSLLDLQSLLKANQLLAQEIQLDALLRQMFSVLLENAGAERGAIVLVDEGRLILEVAGGLRSHRQSGGLAAGGIETQRLSKPLVDAQQLLPVPLLETVRLTRQTLVLNHPASDGRFTHSPYFAASTQPGGAARPLPKSVLCLPVLHQGQLLALVYLENSLLEDAFTLSRQHTLELLASQAAISLLNARLVEDLESKVAQRTEQLRRMSMRDGLTGIANRRAFDESLQLEWRRSQRMQHPISLLMIDIDHFKLYNDHYGHIDGDRCIQLVAQVLRVSAERAGDCVARYGGEEFAVLLPQTDAHAAEVLAQNCIATLTERALPHARSSTAAIVTLSIGIATRVADDSGPEALLRAADAALYEAKRGGRNRVVIG